MSAFIYRFEGNRKLLIAEFRNSDDAVICFKSIAYNLGERLVMEVAGPVTVTPPHCCHLNGNKQYVLNPVLREDVFY